MRSDHCWSRSVLIYFSTARCCLFSVSYYVVLSVILCSTFTSAQDNSQLSNFSQLSYIAYMIYSICVGALVYWPASPLGGARARMPSSRWPPRGLPSWWTFCCQWPAQRIRIQWRSRRMNGLLPMTCTHEHAQRPFFIKNLIVNDVRTACGTLTHANHLLTEVVPWFFDRQNMWNNCRFSAHAHEGLVTLALDQGQVLYPGFPYVALRYGNYRIVLMPPHKETSTWIASS